MQEILSVFTGDVLVYTNIVLGLYILIWGFTMGFKNTVFKIAHLFEATNQNGLGRFLDALMYVSAVVLYLINVGV